MPPTREMAARMRLLHRGGGHKLPLVSVISDLVCKYGESLQNQLKSSNKIEKLPVNVLPHKESRQLGSQQS